RAHSASAARPRTTARGDASWRTFRSACARCGPERMRSGRVSPHQSVTVAFALALAFAVSLAVARPVVPVATGWRELLHPSAVDRFARVQVSLRVLRDRVQERELARLQARLAELGQDRAHHAIEDVQDLVAAVRLVHELLL